MKQFSKKAILLTSLIMMVFPVFAKGGKMETFEFSSEKYSLTGTRNIYVYLPKAYFSKKNKDTKFPVLYMFDGQNIWDKETLPWKGWKVETSLEKLVKAKKIKPCIIVGISNNSKRTREYAGWCNALPPGELITNPELFKQHAKEHRLMIVEELIPFVESKYRTIADRSGRVIAGSSYGAFLSAHFAAEHPDVFCGAGLFSGGSTGYEQIIAEDGFNFSEENKVRFYIDCGTGDYLEKTLLPESQALKDYLISKGYKEASSANDKSADVFYQECERHAHNEAAWAIRIPDFLQFMY
jgi:enterochelin esterase-like enzyme